MRFVFLENSDGISNLPESAGPSCDTGVLKKRDMVRKADKYYSIINSTIHVRAHVTRTDKFLSFSRVEISLSLSRQNEEENYPRIAVIDYTMSQRGIFLDIYQPNAQYRRAWQTITSSRPPLPLPPLVSTAPTPPRRIVCFSSSISRFFDLSSSSSSSSPPPLLVSRFFVSL